MFVLKSKIFFVLFILVSFLLLFGCVDLFSSNPVSSVDLNKGPSFFEKLVDSNVSYSVSGFVTDSDRVLLEGVIVYFGDVSTVTDKSGFYLLETKLSGKAIVSFEKEGFVPIHKSVDLGAGNSSLDVLMFKEEVFVKVDLSNIDVSMKGASLKAEANSFVIKGTNQKATDAQISLTPFDPTNEIDVEAFPGEFEGELISGEVTAIESFGFAKIQAENESGEKLDLEKGKKATITMPISPNQINTAPAQIPLWNFDERKGTWVEKGTATKYCEGTNCYYKGDIDTIASWWNCDATINNSGNVDFNPNLGGSFLGCVLNPGNCIKNWLKDKWSAAKKWASDAWDNLKGAGNQIKDWVKTATDYYKDKVQEYKENRAMDIADQVREKLKERYPEMDFGERGDRLDIPYDKKIETAEDLADAFEYYEELFKGTGVDNDEIMRVARNSTRYGYGGDSDLAEHSNPAIKYAFESGELSKHVKFGALSKNNHEVTLENGDKFDVAHALIGADAYYRNTAALGLLTLPVKEILRYGSKLQSRTDFADVNPSSPRGEEVMKRYDEGKITSEMVLPQLISQANPPDLRGNYIGTEIGYQNNTFQTKPYSKIIRDVSKSKKVTATVDYYEKNVYLPLKNGTPASEVMPAIQSLKKESSLFGFLESSIGEANKRVNEIETKKAGLKNISKSVNASFSSSETRSNDLIYNEYGVDVETGGLNIILVPGLISYSSDRVLSPNQLAFPFSVFTSFIVKENGKDYLVTQNSKINITDSTNSNYSYLSSESLISFNEGYYKFNTAQDRKSISESKTDYNQARVFLYDDEKLVYVAKSKNTGNFLSYKNNLLDEIFEVYDGYYFGKTELSYSENKLTSIKTLIPGTDAVEIDTIKYYLDGKIRETIIDGVKREFVYDSLGRVINQKIGSNEGLLFLIDYNYLVDKTLIYNYYKGEVLLGISTYNFGNSGINYSYEENIDLSTAILFEENLIDLDIPIKEMINDGQGKAVVSINGKDYASSYKKEINLLNEEPVSLMGPPNGKSFLRIKIGGNILIEDRELTLPAAGQRITYNMDNAFVIIPIELDIDSNEYGSVGVMINNTSKNYNFRKNDYFIAVVEPGKDLEFKFYFNNSSGLIRVGPLSKDEVFISQAVKFVNNQNLYKTFDCNTHYAYVKDVKVDGKYKEVFGKKQELYFDGVKIDEAASISNIVIFDNNIAYEKYDYFDSSFNVCNIYKWDECDAKNVVVYNGKVLGEGKDPKLWGSHYAYCNSDNKFVYDGKIFEESKCISSRYDYRIIHDNYLYRTIDESMMWNDKKIIDSKEYGQPMIQWVDYNNVGLFAYPLGKNKFKDMIFKNGELVWTPDKENYSEDCAMSSFGTIWRKTKDKNYKNETIYMDGKLIMNLDETGYSGAVVSGKNYLLLPPYGEASNLIFNGNYTPILAEGGVELGEVLFDNQYLVSLNNRYNNGSQIGTYLNGSKQSDTYFRDYYGPKLFENNWILGRSIQVGKDYEFYYNGGFVGSGPSGKSYLFKNNYAFYSNEGLVYNGQVIKQKKDYYTENTLGVLWYNYDVKLFGDHIYYEVKVDDTYNTDIYVDENRIGNKEITKFVIWPEVEYSTSDKMSLLFVSDGLCGYSSGYGNDFYKAWEYCMKYPSEIEK